MSGFDKHPKPVFGIPSAARGRGQGRGRGRGRGRGGGSTDGSGWSGHRQQQQPFGDGAGEGDELDSEFFASHMGDEQASTVSNLEGRYEDVRQTDEIDRMLGFDRHQQGPVRVGWLVNMHETSVADVERNSTISAVDYYFLEPDGGSFKCTMAFKPYLYVVCREGSEGEVEEWAVRRFDRLVDFTETVSREDLQMANHLTGRVRRLVKLGFRNVQDLMSVRRELQPILRRNERQREVVSAYADHDVPGGGSNGGSGVRSVEDALVEMREFDVPYYLRVAIDKGIRVGHWYDVAATGGEITLTSRPDLVARADPVVLAFDIETTKLPLKFPDAATDMIMMISYMVDGQGYLITNRDVVSQDIEDFEYTPTAEFPGPFAVFNEADEAAVLRRFFAHVRSARPTVVATYNGDSFDWPFVDARARHHGMDLRAETGWARDGEDEYKSRACVHMDCLRWVKRDSYLPVGSQGLKAVTTAKLGYNPMEIDPEDMTRFAQEQPQTLAQYSVSDAVATYYLYMKYVHPFIFSLCNIIPLNPDDVLRKGSGTLCETLLMVEAFAAGVAIPNKHADAPERTWQGHLVETETYVGGHVEALEAGVFRSDIPMQFRVDADGAQRLLDELDRALRFSIEVEGRHALADVENYDEVRSQIAARLADLRDSPVRSEPPLLYHLDVAAMYPNIILTNRLQPDAMVDDATCARCDFNEAGKQCDRRMPWLWRGEYFPAKRGEVAMLRGQLGAVGAAGAGAGAAGRAASAAEQAAALRKRVADYSRKVYHRLREVRVEEREAVVCQREHPFYIDTVRSFRDRRYVYKGLHKKEKRSLDAAVAAGDGASADASRKLVVLYDSLQLAHKCILNSFYGYVMRKGARWHSLEMAGVVCLTGSRIIQMARQRVEQMGRPLELDTDGIWCALPRTFPENYAFRLRGGKGAFGISYPCTMLNHLVFDAFTNHQYQDRGPDGAYSVRAENSIFFEVDGPYRAMVLPASKEADRLLKKRYAVFNDDGSLAELKGFEVKRRGELKLIKIFQAQIFGEFLHGGSLAECYAAVARVADQWLDILFSRARGLPDAELFDLITENRSMSKALDEYGGQKSTSICTARRLAEFLGDQMVRDRGLACKFVVSRQPAGQPVSERAVPVAIFAAEPATRRRFLRRWLRDDRQLADDVDIRDILDWDYYLERFGSVIQKLITIPAAMQGVANPVPRVRHPDWLAKRVAAAASRHRQRQITDVFKVVPGKRAGGGGGGGGDIEDIGRAPAMSATSAMAQPRRAVVSSAAQPRSKPKPKPKPGSAAGLRARLAELRAVPAPDPAAAYAPWLAHAKQAWAVRRQLRALRRAGSGADGLDGADDVPATAMADGGFFTRTQATLARSVWHVLQWAETDTPGELTAWVLLGAAGGGGWQLQAVRVAVPRTLYVASTAASSELAGSRFFSPAPAGTVLPRGSSDTGGAGEGLAMHLYRCTMDEREYGAFRSSWSAFFAHPRIAGVYEAEVTALDRAMIHAGATAWLGAQARRQGVGRSAADVVALDALDTRRTTPALPLHLAAAAGPSGLAWRARDVAWALFFHVTAADGRQMFALVDVRAARGHVWVAGAAAGAAPQLQLPNLERLYRESLAALDGSKGDGGAGAFAYPAEIAFTTLAYATASAAHRAVSQALAQLADSPGLPTVLAVQAGVPARQLQRAGVRALASLPCVALPAQTADATQLPLLDWQRHAARRMVSSLLHASRWLDERAQLAQYGDVPLGNLPADAPLFLADVFFARRLALANHVLWWSPSARADLGGRQDDEAPDDEGLAEALLGDAGREGSYPAACVEIEVRGLAVNTVLKAALVNEIEGAAGVFGFNSSSSSGGNTAAAAATALAAPASAAAALMLAADGNDDDDDAVPVRTLDQLSLKRKQPASDSPSQALKSKPEAALASAPLPLATGGPPASTFHLLRGLLRTWHTESTAQANPFAAMMAEHFFRWLTWPSAHLYDPQLASLVRSLMRKVLLQLRAELRRLGLRIVYGSADKLVVATGKKSVAAAQAAVDYVVKAVAGKPLFEALVLTPLQYWSFLLWMDAANYGGIVAADAGAGDGRIEMLWCIKEYLPPLVQQQFELAVAEFIYKLASFHAQQQQQQQQGALDGEEVVAEEDAGDDDSAATKVSAKGAFYRRLLGQYFTRKLLAAVAEIRDATASAAQRDDEAMHFPRLPGSKLAQQHQQHQQQSLAPAGSVALEFVKFVTRVFALDRPAGNFVRILRRNLLQLLDTGEFSAAAEFHDPCARLLLPRVVCDHCTFSRDMDFCRDADLLPGAGAWACLACGAAYDRRAVEERLVEQLQRALLVFQTQDLVCARCRMMKQDNFSAQCAECAGRYRHSVDPREVRGMVDVYYDVADMNNLEMLRDLAQWARAQTHNS
ncbi:DNA polymerase epsilon catalytic subunit [Coemansia erecta]|uniref:DNA polymerase epsilon catalytic subunit n=1 Tax=Coemansia erecta TaxID=147472 RepID=A0A9W7XZK0_9FUNG|nr:DNA polymerase epsilon catalytic subunit [Coemansia erecta]